MIIRPHVFFSFDIDIVVESTASPPTTSNTTPSEEVCDEGDFVSLTASKLNDYFSVSADTENSDDASTGLQGSQGGHMGDKRAYGICFIQ